MPENFKNRLQTSPFYGTLYIAILGLLYGKKLGVGLSKQKNGLYCAGFVDKFGKRRLKRSKKLQECRQWTADATYIDGHNGIG